MPTTAGDSLRYPSLTDTPNVPRDIQYLADDVQAVLTNSVARKGSAVSGSFATDTAVSTSGPTGGFVVPSADGAGAGLTFIAPPSGRVQVTVEGHIQCAGNFTQFLSYFIKTGSTIGSGTAFTSPVGARSATHGPNTGLGAGERANAKCSQTSLITGLAAGATYNIYFVSNNPESATMDVSYRRLTVIPILL